MTTITASVATNAELAKTLGMVKALCNDFDGSGISSIAATAGLMAVLPYWESHLAEGHSPQILVDDITELRAHLGRMADTLKERLAAETLVTA
jgi:hypothetical protein